MLIKLGLLEKNKPPNPAQQQEAAPPPEPARPEQPVSKELEDALRELLESDPQFAEELPAAAPEAAPVAVPEKVERVTEGPELRVPPTVPEAMLFWLARYRLNPSEAGRHLRELAAKAPEVVAEVLLPRYEAGECGDAKLLVASLLGRNVQALRKLCDPEASLENAVGLAQSLSRQEPRFDAHFAKNLLLNDQSSDAALERGFTILEQLGSGLRLIPILIQFLRSPNNHIRSRAALTIGRIAPPRTLMVHLMRDGDDRVRANLIEGLWKAPGDHSDVFRQALRDPHQRVVGNALIGLHRAGQNGVVVPHVARLARSPEAPMRATASWVMGQTGQECYAKVLRNMMSDPDASVRRNALIALRRIKMAQQGTAPSALTALSSPSSDASVGSSDHP